MTRTHVEVNPAGEVIASVTTHAVRLDPLPSGAIDITAHPDREMIAIGRKRWTGSMWEAAPTPVIRVLSPLDFARRFTLAEEVAIDTLADTNRTVKVWMRRLTLAARVDLDHADVISGLAYLKSVGIPLVWADAPTADQRIAAIRA